MTISEDGVEIVQPPEQDTAVVETSAPEPVLEPAPASEVDVEVVDDTPEQDRNRKPPAPDAKEYDPDEDDELKAYSENSRIRRRFATMKWQQKVTIHSLRFWLFVTAGVLSYPRGQTTIKLAVPRRERAWWCRLWEKISSPLPNCNAVENRPAFTS